MTESLCDAKYSENYSLGTKTDKDENEFKYVSQFRKNNHEEFLECLEPLTDPHQLPKMFSKIFSN